jgi:transcriptional regulator with XRE-family HTH domain
MYMCVENAQFMVNGRQIASARVWLGISQAELATASKVATRTIAHLENGGRIPHDRTLKALVDCLEEMGIEFLMDDDNAGVGIRVRRPKLHPSISSAREQRSEESDLAGIRKRKSAKRKVDRS